MAQGEHCTSDVDFATDAGTLVLGALRGGEEWGCAYRRSCAVTVTIFSVGGNDGLLP